MARKREENQDQNMNTRVFLRGQVYWLGYRLNGQRHEVRESLRTADKAEAMGLAKRRLMELGIVAPQTIAGLLEALIQEYQMQGRKSIEAVKSRVKTLVRLLGERPVQEVTTPVLRQYVQARLQAGKSPATVNRELSALHTAMAMALDDGMLDRLPKFPRLKETGLRQGTYTREEFERIHTELASHLKPLFLFGYLTGRRKGEILQIKWEDVHLEEGYITVRASTTKTGQPDRIPLFGELMVLIRELPKDGEFLFQYQGKPLKYIRWGWKAACRRAGLPDKLFHDLRRTVATDLVMAGADYKTAMAVTGHKSMSVFQRYQIVNQDSIKAAMDRLNKHRKGEK